MQNLANIDPSFKLGGTDPLYFWNIDDGRWQQFLSQWYDCHFTDDAGVHYTSTEEYMMYQKAMLFGDNKTARKIQEARNPARQKTLGREVAKFDRRVWNENKIGIVETGNLLKFSQSVSRHQNSDPEPSLGTTLKSLLLETGNRELVEASEFDRVWGIGFSIENAPTSERRQWGDNLLGKAIMNVRQRLRQSDKTQGVL